MGECFLMKSPLIINFLELISMYEGFFLVKVTMEYNMAIFLDPFPKEWALVEEIIDIHEGS